MYFYFIYADILSDVTYQVQVRAGTIGITGDVLWGPYDEFWILNGNYLFLIYIIYINV